MEPLRARKLQSNGTLKPFVDFNYFGNPKTLNCDRDCKEMYIMQICPYQLLDQMFRELEDGYYLKMDGKNCPNIFGGGCDVDFKANQTVEYWLLKNGFKK